MELLGILLVVVLAIAFYIDYRSTKSENADLREQLNKRERRKESRLGRALTQNEKLDGLLVEKTTELLDVKYKLYALSKDSITITRHAPLDVDKLAQILHDVEHSGMHGIPDNVNGLLSWLHGKERNKWPHTLQYHNIGHDMVVWQGLIGHPAPYGLQQVIAHLEHFHEQKQQVNANGYQ